jgi:5-methylcytosine-specific restriction endonuclease McrA
LLAAIARTPAFNKQRRAAHEHPTQHQMQRSPYVPASSVKVVRSDGTVEYRSSLTPRQLRAVVRFRDVPPWLRKRIFDRDRGHCRYCGSRLERAEAQIDHVVPVAKGGSNKESNLVTSCADCNHEKGVELWNPRSAT